MEKDREEFEKWKKEHSMNLEITIRDSNGDYQYIETRRDWYVWWNAIATLQPEIDALKAEIERLRADAENASLFLLAMSYSSSVSLTFQQIAKRHHQMLEDAMKETK